MVIVKKDPRYVKNRSYIFYTSILDGKTLAAAPVTTSATGGAAPVGDIPQRIYQAAMKNKGQSSASGPDRGKNACAWALNKFCIEPAGLQLLGARVSPYNYPIAVNACEQALINGRGKPVTRAEAVPGDIWVMSGSHIGIITTAGGTRVLSNSSSKAKFNWEDSIDGMSRAYQNRKEKIYRVLN